jgi:hypothetical protein
MELSTETIGVLVLVSLALNMLALGAIAAGRARRRREAAEPVKLDPAVRALFERQGAAIGQLETAVRQLTGGERRLDGLVRTALRHVGLVRYDAFEDVGGRLSFSCALLDDHGNGVVITSINGRQETRVYAKPIDGGKSPHNLSAEETEAIRRAMAAPAHEAVRTR